MDTEARVITALGGRQPDRVPVFLYLNPYTENWEAADPSYSTVMDACREYADVICDWYCPSGFCCSAAPLESQTIPQADGTTRHLLQTPRGPISRVTTPDWRGAGLVKNWIVTEEDALRVLSIPSLTPRPDLGPFRETRQRLRGKAIAQITLNDPICWLGGITQPETLAIWTLENRPLIRRFLDVTFERTLALLEHCLREDAGPLLYFNGPEYALPPLMSPADFEEFVVEYDRRLVELIHSWPGKYVIVHSHGRVNRFLERFAALGMDGLNVLEPPPLGDVELADAKRRIGKRVCLIGNIQYDDLARSSREQVRQLVRQTLAAGAPGGGFILSPCASPYEHPLPPKAAGNFIEYLRAAHDYGRYPA